MPADDEEHRQLEAAVLRLEAHAASSRPETPLERLQRIRREIRTERRPKLTLILGGGDDA